MASHTITVPESITVCDPLSDEPIKMPDGKVWVFDFKTFVLGTILRDTKFSQGWESIAAAIEIRKKVKETAPLASFELSSDEYRYLAEAVNTPSAGYQGLSPQILPQFESYFVAIRKAA